MQIFSVYLACLSATRINSAHPTSCVLLSLVSGVNLPITTRTAISAWWTHPSKRRKGKNAPPIEINSILSTTALVQHNTSDLPVPNPPTKALQMVAVESCEDSKIKKRQTILIIWCAQSSSAVRRLRSITPTKKTSVISFERWP